ncbi:DUF983 domain-containing protein [Marinivivus vitaminiproducens]|uniref:DUF983 domain-containing protein n=1 Tax=Marinivivus vitaminiproducens TaxID=3035935 RepID=UPI0027A003F3|nr:DUF983 domain-containing protein [Geminicoccaceae bacterium SCSIO 64248]
MAATARTSDKFLLHGLAGRCPHCGRGPLFSGFLSVNPVCEACGENLAQHSSDDGPAYFVMSIVGTVVVAALLIVEVNFGWPVWLHLAVWLPLTVVLSLILLRPIKGLMIATQYKTKARDTGEIG